MAKRDEEIKVGALIVAAVILFLTALVMVGGFNLFRKRMVSYTTYVKFAGGLEPGSFVRFAGLKVGTVQAAEIDRRDSTRIRVRFQVRARPSVRIRGRGSRPSASWARIIWKSPRARATPPWCRRGAKFRQWKSCSWRTSLIT
jgi:hypothetical protein